jgi:hypothetical protein
MKKGKTSKINIFDNIKSYYGTVDSKELKSIYVVLQTWIEPKLEIDNWNRVAGNLKREIQHTLLDSVDIMYFDRNNIIDLDLRTSGIQIDKKSFLNLEITLYLKNKNEDFKSPILKNKINQIISSVYLENLNDCKYFNLHKSKTEKVKQ